MDLSSVLFEHSLNSITQVLRYTLPVITDVVPAKQYAYNTCVKMILLQFEESLNDDGYLIILDIVKRGNYKSYIDLLVERAVSEACYRLEDNPHGMDIYMEPSHGVIGYDEIANYMIDNSKEFHQKLNVFTYLVFIGIVSNVVYYADNLVSQGVTIASYTIHPDPVNRSIVNVSCLIDKLNLI